MNRNEMDAFLATFLPLESDPFDEPTDDDWHRLERKFGCHFHDDFKRFISLMSKYSFPADILNVANGHTNGNDAIELAYDLEMNDASWDADMIPFHSIGNGDYFCINRSQCPDSPIYYFYHDRLEFERYSSSMEDWVKQLPQFLA